ncbi:MAG: hypothetical protein OXI08_11830, partial [Cyanobacteria bacterium MAG IRC4_bin_6]|nr:hypothetical protein [Cyanobacteria bacterium MAG IRC4_bin_6]
MPIQHLKYITACSGSGLAWVFALLLGAGVTPAAAQSPPTLTLSNPHTSGLVEGQRTRLPITASENPTSSLPVTLQFTRTGDFMNPFRLNCLKGDGTGKAACPYEVDLFDYDPDDWIIIFRTKDDDIDEPDGTLTVVIEYGEGLTSNSVTVDIRDNDPTVVSLARVGSEVISDGGAAEFTVTLGRALVAGEVIDVPLAISGPGVSADGYTLSVTSGTGAALSGTNTLTPNLRFSGAGAQTATLALRPAAASTVERYTIALGPDGDGTNGFDRTGLGTNVGGGADPHGTQNSFHVWKDLGHPSVTITGGPAEISEGSTASFTLTANPAPSTPFTLTVEVTDSGDFATAGQTGSRTVSIGPEGTGSFTVTTVDDSVYEPNGVIRATVQVGSGYTVGVPSSASVAVLELPDDVPYISIKRVPYGINEGGTATFALTASYPPAVPITVNVNVVEQGGHFGNFATPGQLGSRTVTVGTDGRGSLTVTTVDDSTFELNKLFKATVQSGSDYKVGSPSKASIYVWDNDKDSQPLIEVGGPTQVTEGQEFDISTMLYRELEEPLSITRTFVRTGDFWWSKGTVTKTEDLPAGTPKSSSWAWSTNNDGIDEPDGTITMTLEYGNDPTVLSHTVLIRDNDPTVVSLVRTGTVSTVAFTVTLGRALVAGEVIDVPLVVSGGGVSADDYTLSLTSGTGATLSGTGTLTPTLRFSGAGAEEAMLKLVPAAGSTVERYTIALGPDGDGANGFDRAGLGTNVGGGADPHAQNSFDVGAMEPSVSITGGPDVTEGSAATFTVTASPAPSTPVTVMVDVTDSGSFAGDGQAGSRSVTVGVDGTGSLTVTTVNDGIDDWKGAITATLQAGADYTVSAPSSAAVAVLNDGVQLPDLNLFLGRPRHASRVTEGTRLFFRVWYSRWVNYPLQARLTVTRTGDLFRVPTRKSFISYSLDSIDEHAAAATFPVHTKNDDVDEPDGTVTVVGEYGNSDASRTTSSVTVSIRDNDPTVVSLSRTGAGAVSAGSGVAFTVSLGRALVAGEVIDVPLAVSGAGVSVDDYTLSVTGGTGAALSGTDTLRPTLRFSGAGAQTATLELVASVAKQYHIALGPDGRVVNGFDRPGLGTNVGGGADPHATENHFHVEVTPAQQQQLFQQHAEPVTPEVGIALAAGGTEGAEVLFMLSVNPAPP